MNLELSYLIRTIAFVSLLLTTAAFADGADKTPRELIEALIKRPWPGENYPTLPSFSEEFSGRIGNEIASSPTIAAAAGLLDPRNSNTDWFAAIKSLEGHKAVWMLQACLCHPDEDVQIKALRALGRLKDPRAVPFILIYADCEAIEVAGSEIATIHGIIHESIARTLSAITGVRVTLHGQDPEGLKRGIRLWTQWELDHTK